MEPILDNKVLTQSFNCGDLAGVNLASQSETSEIEKKFNDLAQLQASMPQIALISDTVELTNVVTAPMAVSSANILDKHSSRSTKLKPASRG